MNFCREVCSRSTHRDLSLNIDGLAIYSPDPSHIDLAPQ
jgi:hypothetical protein